jgi:hypothetical protein
MIVATVAAMPHGPLRKAANLLVPPLASWIAWVTCPIWLAKICAGRAPSEYIVAMSPSCMPSCCIPARCAPAETTTCCPAFVNWTPAPAAA